MYTRNFFRSIWVLLLSVLCLVSSCTCPACNQKDQVQRCQCCVYRQLGKRSSTQTFPKTVLDGNDLSYDQFSDHPLLFENLLSGAYDTLEESPSDTDRLQKLSSFVY